MRRPLAVLVALAVASSATAGTGPALQVIDAAPLTVRGVNFHPGEHVRVTAVLVGHGRYVRTSTAGARGGFVVRFRGLDVDSCGAYRIVAAGDGGSRATRSMSPPPCGPAP